ncbi:MAG: oligosaccharide flippase family protein [Ferribacterium limneticum]
MTDGASPDRTKNYFRQVKGSVLFKGLAVGASFFAVPLMIQYLGNEQYGIWSTLLSIMSWAVFFDFGIGNGLRNKLAESLAKNQVTEATGYISSGYTWIGVISAVLLVLVAVFSFLVPWQVVFNTNLLSNGKLQNAVLISAVFVLINFWLGLINQVLNAVQKTSWVVFGQFLSNGLGLIVVHVLSRTTEASLLLLVAGYGLSIVAANLLLSFGFYVIRGDLRPKLSYDRKHLYPLLSLGGQFFVIQLAALVIFTTDKILITQLFGPQYVARYDVVFKLFSVITLIHGLISAPLWSAYTDAYYKSDFKWMGVTLRKQLLIFVCVVAATVVLCFMAGSIIKVWVGPSVETPFLLILSVSVFLVVSIWNNIFAYFLNGVGEIRLQLYTAVAAMLINIPVAIILVNDFGFGVDGVVWATCLSLSIFAIVGPIQVMSILARAK